MQSATRNTQYAIGPYHPDIPAPLRLDIGLSPGQAGLLGAEWRIVSASVELGYNYIGIEERVALGGLDWARALQLVEELCAPCSQANVLAFVHATEAMAHLIVPPRAAYLRLVLAELERVASHLLNAAETLAALGMPERESAFRDLRERTIHAMAEWSGARLQPGLITYGGLTRNMDENGSRALTLAARHVERALRSHVNAIINSSEIARRLVGLGVISTEEAVIGGLRGPVARASGVATDVRAAFPTGAYEEEAATIVVQRGGDAFSRLVVRLLEALESFRLVEQVLDDLPPGPVKARGSAGYPMGERGGSGVGKVEGPRGEVFCWVRGAGEGPAGLHISAGSHPTLAILPGLLRGQRLDDIRLLLLSVDLCLPCAER